MKLPLNIEKCRFGVHTYTGYGAHTYHITGKSGAWYVRAYDLHASGMVLAGPLATLADVGYWLTDDYTRECSRSQARGLQDAIDARVRDVLQEESAR